MASYFNFASLGETVSNFTYEILGRFDTLAPTWLSVGIQLMVFVAIIVVLGGVAGFATGILDPGMITRPLRKIGGR